MLKRNLNYNYYIIIRSKYAHTGMYASIKKENLSEMLLRKLKLIAG